jgi:hypothetical protein
MAISRVPGYSLVANLDRQGTDLYISSNGQSLTYWDVSNYRFGIGTDTPEQKLHVAGHTIIVGGDLRTDSAGFSNIGNVSHPWNYVNAEKLLGTISTVSQPNITSLGTLTALTVSGDSTLDNTIIAPSSFISFGNNIVHHVASPQTDQDAASKGYVDNAVVAGSTLIANVITLGTSSDGNLISPAAYTGWTTATKVTDAIDDLNEMMENVRNNTFVKSISFTGTPTAGGEGTTVTLTLSTDGNPNRYDIDWGDGETPTTATTDSTPSHTYTDNTNSPFTVAVTAYNNGGSGTGSTASASRTDYIIIYTANPVAGLELYRAASGGSALSGSTLYVTEGETFYVKNTTTNTSMADVEYNINFGDGTANASVASDSATGGVSGDRYDYSYAFNKSTGTGTLPVQLYLTSHTTANPAVIPTKASLSLKVYDANIAAPNGLSTKTITFDTSIGTSPLLAADATDNTGGTTLSPGDSVSRTTTSASQIRTVTTTSYAYNADSGYLSALINGTDQGNITLSSGSQVGTTGNLQIIAESDYNLLNAAGSTVSFASSIYAPGTFTGFTARATSATSKIPTGINSFRLAHNETGQTNLVEFVKDDLTSAPTMSDTGLLLETAAGTKRYVSGIPYYNSGSPTLRFYGLEVTNFIGQTYRNTTTPLQVVSSTNAESTTGSAVATQSYTYTNIDGTTTMLSGGIPKAGTGVGSAYALGNITVAITSSSVRTVEQIGVLAYNTNGTGSTATHATKVQVHTAAQSGISEIAIAVADALGAGFDDDGVRIFDFSAETTNTPTYNGATNFYTNSLYAESADPGVEGTKEATIRLGVLAHNVVDYSAGYLPVGPDRSGDTGTQYFTFAFRRTTMANFDLNITSSSGVTGVWIAAPGTGIDDASTLNGWLDTATTYAGAGVPGASTGDGGNGSNGCAFTSGDRITPGASLSGGYTMTLGSENATNATGNVVLVRIALASGESITALSVGVAS